MAFFQIFKKIYFNELHNKQLLKTEKVLYFHFCNKKNKKKYFLYLFVFSGTLL